MSNTPMWTGLESVALALIFAPEPFTTFLGVGLLSYARKKRAEEKQAMRRSRPLHHFTDFYTCKVKMVQGSAIAYHVSPIRQGQLPIAHSTISKLYETRKEWECYQKTLNARPRGLASRSPAQHPAGLLKTPFLRYQTGLMPRRVQT